MNVSEFVSKWTQSTRTERSAAHEHYFDLCALFDFDKPGDVDPHGTSYTMEKGVKKIGGGQGFADVWKKGQFAWEYKKKHRDLDAAYNQLLQYSAALDNPPLLIACDMDRIVIRTHFTGFPTRLVEISLDNLATPRNLKILRDVFHDPDKLRPDKTIEKITEEAASTVAEIAPSLRKRCDDPTKVAHYLDRLVFCMFAEDVGLLPGSVFSKIVEKPNRDPRKVTKDIADLFEAMAHGGDFWGETIPHFNGSLFDDSPALELAGPEISNLKEASRLDWSDMDPSIFGTLFERVMDPDLRSQLGAHYTGFADIATLVEPVVMAPLRREWDDCRAKVDALVPDLIETPDGANLFVQPADAGNRKQAAALIAGFADRLRSVRVLDPACGSGNFLYVTLRMLKDLEKDVLVFARSRGLPDFPLRVGPHQLHGIEKNEYAFDLAQMTVWIGLLQWHRANGFPISLTPILQPLKHFENKDAILDLSRPDFPAEPDWPEVDFIVGNPPFLGDKRMRGELGDDYVTTLRQLFADRIPGQSDLCCYWFEKARDLIKRGKTKRAGLLATQGIRGGANREVLNRIKETGQIFWAVSDRNWILDGANVHVSMVGFDDGEESIATLDGVKVSNITAQLSSKANVIQARSLQENSGLGFIGVAQKAPFDIDSTRAREMLLDPNPDGRPNSDVLRPTYNAKDVTTRPRNVWNIDFGLYRTLEDSALYISAFRYVEDVIYPMRVNHREARQVKSWWLFARPCPDMRRALAGLTRYIATPRVSKHRVFLWVTPEIICDSALVVYSRSDDYFFGVLQSRMHEGWARSQGTQVRERESGFRYTPSTCFVNFPFPEPTEAQREAISKEAKRLDELRTNWLNPPEWTKEEVLEFPGSVDGPWSRYVHDPDARGIGTVRYPRLVPRNDRCAADLAKRTLTKLYNDRPSWLAHAHQALDAAVFAAYGWPFDLSDDQILARLLALNLSREPTVGAATAPEPVEDDEPL